MNKILITGKGLIGKELEHHLKKAYEVITIDKRAETSPTYICNIGYEPLPQQLLFEDFNFVIHTAANARVWNSIENPDIAFDNCRSTEAILEFCKTTKTPIIVTSSREVYGNQSFPSTGLTEDKGNLLSESPYTASKVYLEALTHAYHVSYGLDYIITRFSNVFGFNEDSDRIIPMTIKKAYNKEDSTIYNKDKVMNFTFVNDVVLALLFLIKNFELCKNDVYNIAGDKEYKLYDVMSTIYKYFNLSPEDYIVESVERFGEVSRFKADLSKIKSFGWEPHFDVNQLIESACFIYEEEMERKEDENKNV